MIPQQQTTHPERTRNYLGSIGFSLDEIRALVALRERYARGGDFSRPEHARLVFYRRLAQLGHLTEVVA